MDSVPTIWHGHNPELMYILGAFFPKDLSTFTVSLEKTDLPFASPYFLFSSRSRLSFSFADVVQMNPGLDSPQAAGNIHLIGPSPFANKPIEPQKKSCWHSLSSPGSNCSQ